MSLRDKINPHRMRRLLGYSVTHLAAKMGVSTPTIDRLMCNDSRRVNEDAFKWVFMEEMIRRPCPVCGGPMCALASLNKLLCADCKHEVTWMLDPGQKPLVGSNRQDRKTT